MSTEQSPETVADVIGQSLASRGCRFAFGIPGGEVLALMDGLERAGLRFIRVRHESSGGFMAEGTYRSDGAPGVLVATVGPGIANSVLAVANAAQERVPLIVLTGCIDDEVQGAYTHQVFDQQALLRPFVKASYRLTAASASTMVAQALHISRAGRPGPVHLDVPVAVAAQPSPTKGAPPSDRAAVMETLPGDQLDAFARALHGAERPLIIAGLDLVRPTSLSRSSTAILALAGRLQARVITTYKAKGLISEGDELSLGAAGLSPTADRVLLPLVERADVVLCAGYDPIEMRLPWRMPFSPNAKVLELSAGPLAHGMFVSSSVVFGDVPSLTEALYQRLRLLPEHGPGSKWVGGEAQQARDTLTAAFAPTTTFEPRTVGASLFAALPSNAVVTIDTGAHRIVLSQMFVAEEPGQILQSSGLCTMGVAVPLAIGAKLVDPGRPVVAVAGDGGLDMFLGELATAREEKLGIPIVVLDDQALALIELKQRRMALPECGVLGGATDYVAVAESLGGRGTRVETTEQLHSALGAALRAETFTVIHVPIARGAYDEVL